MQYSVISWCSRDNGFLKGLLSLPGKGEKKLLVFVNTKLLTLFKKKLFWDNCRSHAVVRNNIERIYLSPSLPYKQEADIDMNHQLYWNFTSLHTLISVYVCVWVCVCVCVLGSTTNNFITSINSCNHRYSQGTGQFHHWAHLSLPQSTPSPAPSETLATTDLFSSTLILSFQECCINRTM